MIRRIGIFVTCLLLVTGYFWLGYRISLARVQQVQGALSLGAITRISPARNGEDVFQIWSAADPTTGRHLIVCGSDQYPKQNVLTGYVYSSADNGTSWRQTVLDNATKFISEPSCTYAADGRAYFAAGESDTSTGLPRHEWGHLNLFASDDHGMTWNKIWKRKDGWIDWTSMAAAPASRGSGASLIVFGNAGTDKLGHWWGPTKSFYRYRDTTIYRAVAIASHDGGRSFSQLQRAPDPLGFHYAVVWASGSAVLPDGTALFATSASLVRPKEQPVDWWHGHLRVEIFAYSPATGGVRSRAVVRPIPPTSSVFTVTLAQDTSHGRFGGRLYTAWLETNQNEDGIGTLWLGTSDDHGYHWSTREVASASCMSGIKLAVAPNGTLGVIWSKDSRWLDVAVSQDGGRTFGQSAIIAYHAPGPLAISRAGPFNEYWASEILAQQAGKSTTAYADLTHLGVSIQMGQPAGVGNHALVADANGAFHALWAQAEPDGTRGLFTRTIWTNSEASPMNSMLTVIPKQTCSDNGEIHPPLPGFMPALQLTGQRDVSSSFSLFIQNVHYDSATRIVSADVIMKNKGKSIMGGPLSFFGIGLHSDYGTIAAANAAGAIQGQPFWDASSVIPASGLQSGASSKPLTLRFKITKFQPLLNNGRGGDASAMLVRIYQGHDGL